MMKGRIHTAQQRATLAVNRELALLYWQIGRDILARQAAQGWGAKVIERLAHDLRAAFPEMKGFSRANLMYMRAFAQAWPDAAIVQQAVGQLPWGHNLVLLDRLNTETERRWYAAKAVEHGWSRNVLNIHIETRLSERSGKQSPTSRVTLPQSPLHPLMQQNEYGKMPYKSLELALMTTTARFDLKLDADDKDILSRAASLMGTTMAGFVRSAAKEKAQTLLEQESRVTLSKRDFVAFNAAINSAFAPNPALRGALKAASRVKRA